MEASWFTCGHLNYFGRVLYNSFFHREDIICQVNWLRMNCKQLPRYLSTPPPLTPDSDSWLRFMAPTHIVLLHTKFFSGYLLSLMPATLVSLVIFFASVLLFDNFDRTLSQKILVLGEDPRNGRGQRENCLRLRLTQLRHRHPSKWLMPPALLHPANPVSLPVPTWPI
jgi:hypothetical protein